MEAKHSCSSTCRECYDEYVALAAQGSATISSQEAKPKATNEMPIRQNLSNRSGADAGHARSLTSHLRGSELR